MTPLGEVIVFSPFTGAGSCLGPKLAGEASTLTEGASKLRANKANFKLRENMMSKMDYYPNRQPREIDLETERERPILYGL